MKLICPECKTPFSQDEAIDKSWVYPEKHFGCPYCKTYFASNPFKKAWGASISFTLSILGIQWIYLNASGSLPEDIMGGIVMLLGALILGIYTRRQFTASVQQLGKIDTDQRS